MGVGPPCKVVGPGPGAVIRGAVILAGAAISHITGEDARGGS